MPEISLPNKLWGANEELTELNFLVEVIVDGEQAYRTERTFPSGPYRLENGDFDTVSIESVLESHYMSLVNRIKSHTVQPLAETVSEGFLFTESLGTVGGKVEATVVAEPDPEEAAMVPEEPVVEETATVVEEPAGTTTGEEPVAEEPVAEETTTEEPVAEEPTPAN